MLNRNSHHASGFFDRSLVKFAQLECPPQSGSQFAHGIRKHTMLHIVGQSLKRKICAELPELRILTGPLTFPVLIGI
jgi:hypothetical protein